MSMQLPVPTTSTPARWRWTEGLRAGLWGGAGMQLCGCQEGGWVGRGCLQRASQYQLLLRE